MHLLLLQQVYNNLLGMVLLNHMFSFLSLLHLLSLLISKFNL